jgi:hypothetical protein
VSRQIPAIIIVLSKDEIPGSSQQFKNNLETFLNLPIPTQPRARKSSEQKPKSNDSPRSKGGKETEAAKKSRTPKSENLSPNSNFEKKEP